MGERETRREQRSLTDLTLATVGKPTAKQVTEACLVVIYGERLGERVTVREEPVVIGRGTDCDVRIRHRNISRRHCRIWQDDSRYWLEDLGSTNGTFINDKPVSQSEISDGDHITIGQSILKFIGESSVEARYHAALYELATTDGLTGLYNRRHFLTVLDQEIARSRRHERTLSLLLLDMDHFKQINDEHGHPAGDQVLRQVAGLLRERIREDDVLARLGGEEFAVLATETNAEEAEKLADSLRQCIADAELNVEDKALKVTMSIGVAQLRDDENSSSLMNDADQALYQAKSDGRDRVVLASATDGDN